MKAIYKYYLRPGHNQIFTYHESTVLSAIEQDNKIVVYIKVNTDDSVKGMYRNFYCAMTGEDISNYCNSNFIGTVKLNNGEFIIHVLELL